MPENVPIEDQSTTIVLEPIEEVAAEVTEPLYEPTSNSIYQEALKQIPTYEAYQLQQLQSGPSTLPKAVQTLGRVVLSLDTETTGLNPWEYKIIVCSVWDLNEPKSMMKTFAGWDEETLIRELFDYIKSKKPEVILAFNAKFEARGFITRAMLYQIKAPWIFSAAWHDMLAILNGGWGNGLSGTQPGGSEEQWLKFFFNETKPFTIDECFEGVREGRLDEMIIRNRTCVGGQGDMYQLLNLVQAPDEMEIPVEKPSAAMIDEFSEGPEGLIQCDICGEINVVPDNREVRQCTRCLAELPEPTAENTIVEQVREFNWEETGMSTKEITAAKKAGTIGRKKVTLEPIDPNNIVKASMVRLLQLGRVPHQ